MGVASYLYAVVAAGALGAGAWYAVQAGPVPAPGGIDTRDGQRFAAVAPSDHGALSDCVVCHRLAPGGQDRSAPSLVGIVGAPVARSDWFAYSPALAARGGTWSEEELDRYLENPTAHVPGTFKTLSPVRSAGKRREIIDALKKTGAS